MSSPAPRRSPAPPHALIAAGSATQIVATRRGEPVTAAQFMHDVRRVGEALPEGRHVLNFCADRYRFAVVFCAAITRGQTTLLPPTTTPNVIAAMRAFAADVFYVTDDETIAVDLPRASLPGETACSGDSLDIPQVPGSLPEVLTALEKDHEYLLEGGVFTEDLIEMWINLKREEIDAIRLRPHPYEFDMYYDI